MGCGASTPAGSGGADGAPLAASGAPGDRKSVGRASAGKSNFRAAESTHGQAQEGDEQSGAGASEVR